MKSTGAKEHRGCVLLKPEENEEIFRLIGNRCQCLAAGVIQLYLTEPPTHREWIRKNTGVITLIRDNPKRSYFLRLYCLQRKAMLWEQELYNSMDYNAPITYFHTFEGEDCMAAFNFANETEAMIMRSIISERLSSNRQRRQERKSKIESEAQKRVTTLPRRNLNNTSDYFSSSANVNMINGSPSTLTTNGVLPNISIYKRATKREKDPKRKLTTADIGLPSNFRHVLHMGWDVCKGLEVDAVDPTLMQFFDVAGVTKQQLTSRKTRDFIYEFIGNHGGLSAVQHDLGQLTNESLSKISIQPSSPIQPHASEAPPPIPARLFSGESSPGINNNQTRSTRPMPPVRTNIPPPPPNAPPAHRTPPLRPPLPSGSPALLPSPAAPLVPPPPPRSTSNITNTLNSSSVLTPLPPPPPPLPDFGDPECPTDIAPLPSNNGNNNDIDDMRPKLMDAIRNGTTLKRVEQCDRKPYPVIDSRNDLLNQIRQGTQLKPVLSEPKSPTPVGPGGLAGALSRALAERSRLLGYTDDSQDSSSETTDDDDWDN
ncbi:hypothetical protein PV325_008597 [Microctonus aethiopoides]|uniref:Wiskott-Aldrich syndrome protein n=1 Tax=Microctonus aethiopoides TaxID=144406 RepID=A0AA39FX07_9HYME|nr:hypothetical protein PV325_008597 [Microctonus aethiopoides]KAK0177091.1 hypothetical protein PV328_001170 [Microctonus aethiopoides]